MSSRDKMQEMQAEMARFEEEISGPEMFPPQLRQGPPMSNRPHFLPPQLSRPQPLINRLPPPPPPRLPAPPSRSSAQSFRSSNSSAVISAAPKVYSAAPVITKKRPAEEETVTMHRNKSKVKEPLTLPAKPIEVKVAPSQPPKAKEEAKQPVSVYMGVMGEGPSGIQTTLVNPPAPKKSKKSSSQTSNAKPQMTKKERKIKNKTLRSAGGQVWQDSTLLDWQPNDFRIFCGDLGHEVTDEILARTFNKYPSFLKAKVIRDKKSQKSKGYGFVSFQDPGDFARAMREVNGKYVGNRPIKLRKSQWKERTLTNVRKKDKEKKKMGMRL